MKLATPVKISLFTTLYFIFVFVSLSKAELLNRIEMYVLGETENLPSSARSVIETQPGCEPCPFFSKVAACRFRDACSRLVVHYLRYYSS